MCFTAEIATGGALRKPLSVHRPALMACRRAELAPAELAAGGREEIKPQPRGALIGGVTERERFHNSVYPNTNEAKWRLPPLSVAAAAGRNPGVGRRVVTSDPSALQWARFIFNAAVANIHPPPPCNHEIKPNLSGKTMQGLLDRLEIGVFHWPHMRE